MNLPHSRTSAVVGLGLVLATAAAVVYPNRSVPAAHAVSLSAKGSNATIGLNVLPADLVPAVVRKLAAQSYQTWSAKPEGLETLRFHNPAQHFSANINRHGMHMQLDGNQYEQMEIRLVALHSSNVNYPLTAISPSVKSGRVEIPHGRGLTEWYVNSPLGLEQGFTLVTPVVHSASLILVFRLGGNLKPALKGNALEFRNGSDKTIVRYADLLAMDADHHALPARLTLRGHTLKLAVNTRQAHFPVTIDPLFSAVTAFADPPAANGDFFGYSLAFSSDGTTALVGAPDTVINGHSQAGAVYAFTQANGTWSTTPTMTLQDPNDAVNDDYGYSVALSADGKTFLIGSPGLSVAGNNQAGGVYVYTFSSNSSTAQEFTDPNDGAYDRYGTSVGLSDDGKTILVGDPYVKVGGNTSVGVVYVYNQNNGTWSGTPSQTFADPLAGAFDDFGTSVALAGNNGSALIGAPGTTVSGNGSVGAAYVFLQNNGTWSGTPAHAFADPLAALSDGFGSSVALSSDGSTALIGAAGTTVSGNSFAGAAYVYTQNGSVWPNSPIAKFDDPQGGASDFFGSSVALSADGGTALVGAYGTTVSGISDVGTAYVYVQNNGVWSGTPTKTMGNPTGAAGSFGNSVTLSNDGTVAFISAPTTAVSGNSAAGMAFLFASTVDLSLALSSNPASVTTGQSLTYMLTAINNDNQITATNLTLTDALPAGVSFVSDNAAGGTCNNSSGTVICTLASLAPQATWQPSITVTATSAGSIKDTATVSASQPDPNTANNSANVTTNVTTPPASPPSSGGGGGAFDGWDVLLLLLTLLYTCCRANSRKERRHKDVPGFTSVTSLITR